MARILVIDPDPAARALLGALLRREGHEVIEARTGVEGVRLFRATVIDLTFTALLIHDIEALVELRAASPQTKLIALSTGDWTGESDGRALVQRLGAQRILAKPFTPEEMFEAVRALLAADA